MAGAGDIVVIKAGETHTFRRIVDRRSDFCPAPRIAESAQEGLTMSRSLR